MMRGGITFGLNGGVRLESHKPYNVLSLKGHLGIFLGIDRLIHFFGDVHAENLV